MRSACSNSQPLLRLRRPGRSAKGRGVWIRGEENVVAEANGKQQAENTQLPVFYSQPEAMNPTRHGALSLVDRPDFAFAARAHAIPVVANEMPAAMRSYPIVFVGPQKTPVAVTGVRRDQNLFVDANSRWVMPHYVPAYVRRYPFILAADDKAGKLTLCIDRGSERVIETATAPLIDDGAAAHALFEGSEPSETTRKALAFCQEFQKGVLTTRAMVEKIDALKLFAERRSTVTLEGGETLNLTDFQVIDENAFNRLADEEFLELRRSGALALIYCHFASMNSWTSLVYQAGLSEAPAAAA